jgi:hypothetical protein
MPAESVGELLKRVPVLEMTDTIRRAASLIRESDGTRVFVHVGSRIAGTVSEESITELMGRNGVTDEVLDSPIEPLVDSDITYISSRVGLVAAADLFASSKQDVLPVIDDYGSFYGAVYRKDVIGALTKTLRPPTVGGMATPLGVYLTTGSIAAGAGNLGLFLTGISIGVMMALATAMALGIMYGIAAITGLPLGAYLNSPPLTLKANVYDIPFYMSTALTILFFMVLMRLSPLAGYHAAEHMTVHAIEAGEALTVENVRHMQRVHPRCGTNLLAGVGIFLIIVSRFGNDIAVLFALAVVIVGWRAVGAWLQHFVTTKDPSDRQLRSGVAAGNEILDRYQEHPGYQAVGFERIWKLGFLQTLTGLMATTGLLQLLFPSLWR